MRVIAGKYRGKKLLSPIDDAVRPTTDRIKETVFNILASRYTIGERVLDLFCGSGALGIEALSRGAESVTFADKSPESVRLTKENLRGLQGDIRVYTADFRVALTRVSGDFDLILLDPPYAAGYEEEAVRIITERKLLRRGGVIFIEHSRKNNLINLTSSYIIDTRDCGNTSISFLTQAEEHA